MSSPAEISIVVAMSTNRVIGSNNQLPWHLPNDLQYFKRLTMGSPIIMGRKTYESIGRPLPGRLNIVVSRQSPAAIFPCGVPESVRVVASLDEGYAQAVCTEDEKNRVFVIGGEQIYRQSLANVTRLYVTEVHASVEGDAYFPEIALSDWREVGREVQSACAANPHSYAFVSYVRR